MRKEKAGVEDAGSRLKAWDPKRIVNDHCFWRFA